MVAVTVQKVGDALTIVLDEEAQALLGVREGDVLHLDAVSNDELDITVAGPSLYDRLERGRAFLRRYRATFEALAK